MAPLIDHNPHEKRPTNTIWWVLWPIIGLLWLGSLYSFNIIWVQVGLGFLTGMVLATWAIEITGNKAPEWMSPPRRRRP